MMKRYASLLLILAFVLEYNAQSLRRDSIYSLPDFLPARSMQLGMSAGGFTQSTTVPAAFSNRFIDPGFIDDALKEDVETRFKGNNRFAAQIGWQAEALFFTDSTSKANNTALNLAIGTQSIFALKFSDDAFSLAFRGNDNFAGHNAVLNNSSFFNLRYDFFRLSYRKRFETWGFEAGLQAMRGNNFSNIQLEEGSLFTDTSGTYLDVRWKGKIQSSPRSANAWNNYPSAGAAINLRLFWTPVSRRQWHAEFGLSDFGFMHWNNETNDIQRDTAFRFTGLWLGDLITFNDTNFVVGDSLLRRLRGNEEQASFMMWFPFRVHAAVSFRLSSKHDQRLKLETEYRALPGMLPLSTLGYSQKIASHLSLGIDALYGGFGGFNSRFRLSYRGKKHGADLMIWSPEGLLAPTQFSGNGVFIRYTLDL